MTEEEWEEEEWEEEEEEEFIPDSCPIGFDPSSEHCMFCEWFDECLALHGGEEE